MIYCNDYIKLTKGYLRNLVYYQVAVSNMNDDLEEIRKTLGDAKIASYETNPGGASELNGVEAKAEKALQYREKLEQMRKLQVQVEKLERSIEKLPDSEREAVRMFYIYRQSYEEIMQSLHISHSTCRRRISNGTRNVSVMLFGDKALEQVKFVS